MIGRVKKKISLAILVVAVLAIGLVGAIVWYNLGFRQSAEVVTAAKITVYTDAEKTDEVEQGEMLDWGSVVQGPNFKQLWIENTGSVPANITFYYDQQQLQNWGGWTETWDYNDEPIAVNAVVDVTITLTLPPDIGAGHYELDSGIGAHEAS